MRSLTVFLAIAALVVYSAGATPCTDICGGQCALGSQACNFLGTLGDMCGVMNNICSQTCGAACHCADSCAEQCGGEFAACKGDGSNILNVESCGMNMGVCEETCVTQCHFNSLASVVGSLSGAAAK